MIIMEDGYQLVTQFRDDLPTFTQKEDVFYPP
jgi:hypothetical protein